MSEATTGKRPIGEFYCCPGCTREYPAPAGRPGREEDLYRFEHNCPECHYSCSFKWADVFKRELVAQPDDEMPELVEGVLPFGVSPRWVDGTNKRGGERVYRCQSPTCGAYLLTRHLEPVRKTCPCGSVTLVCGDDVPANQYRNIVTMNDEYRADIEASEKEIGRLREEMKRVRAAANTWAAGYHGQMERAETYREVIDAHIRHEAAITELHSAIMDLMRANRKAGIEDGEELERPVSAFGFKVGDNVRVCTTRYDSIPVGSTGFVASIWSILDEQPIGVKFAGHDLAYAFNADELEIEEEIPF